MGFISIQEAIKQGKGKVSLHGWCYRERGSKKLRFLIIRDGSNIIQCIVEKDSVSKQVWNDAERVRIESSLELTGEIKKDDRAVTGYELVVSDLKVIGLCENFPIQKDLSTEFLLDNRHLWLRSRKMTAIMKIKSTILQAFREHYLKQDYIEFTPPILQPTQSEGGSTLFEVKYYKDKLYLTQSAQLYSEAMIFGLEKVFLVSPCFRAEKSKTSRHLSEFWMAEMEAAWMAFDELQDDIEALLKNIVKKVIEVNKGELEILERDLSKLIPIVNKPFKRMTYTEVLELLKKDGVDIEWGKDLRTVEEEKLSDHFDVPVIVSRYPKKIMAFYKPSDPKNEKVALCLDVIAPEHYGEIVGGSQRDLDLKKMSDLLKKEGEEPSNYDWYFDSRKYGSVPHCGHGMGVERVVRWICGLDSIKDSIPFPRTIDRYKP